jgi:hypothetical protein
VLTGIGGFFVNLTVFALFAAATFAGGGTGAHAMPGPASTPSVHAYVLSVVKEAAPDAGSTLSPSGTTGFLTQAGPNTWQTTVLVGDSAAGCTESAAYWLQVTIPGAAPNNPVQGVPSPKPLTQNKPLPPNPTAGSSCEITVKFGGLSRVPVAAVLDIDQGGTTTAITLTVSRDVTLLYYLGIPAITGGVLAILMLLIALWRVRLYDFAGRPVSRRHLAYWTRPLSASGAWTLNDSWATNITGLMVVVATILGVTTATTALFPGVSVDRFVIVNILAGAIVAVSPLVFGVLYAWQTGRSPSVLADAALALPLESTARLATKTATMLPRHTAYELASGERGLLGAVTPAFLDAGATATVRGPAGRVTLLPAGAAVGLPAATPAVLRARTRVRPRGWRALRSLSGKNQDTGTTLTLPAGTAARLLDATAVNLPGDESAALTGASAAVLKTRTRVTLPGGAAGRVLAKTTTVVLPAGTAIAAPARAQVAIDAAGR